MIISRTPFRISFCGGGTDISDFYREHGGCVVSTSIDKYVYLTMVNSFHRNRIILKYSTVENVVNVDDIEHSIFREVLKNYNTGGVEINSTANIPAGTGLGSSSSFTVGLLNTVRTMNGLSTDARTLAEEACRIEIDRLKNPIGKQDQYAAAYGGLNFIRFNKDDTVDVEPIKLTAEEIGTMSDRLLMFYLGGTRSASEAIEGYNTRLSSSTNSKKRLSKLAEELRKDLDSGDIDTLGKTLAEGWKLKKTLSKKISNPKIDEIYDIAIDNGAVGGKLLGAGGDGFMLFYADERDQSSLREALSKYRELPFNITGTGSEIVYNDERP